MARYAEKNIEKEFQSLSLMPLHMPMIDDRRTEMYVKFAKVMLIFQGPVTDSRVNLVAKLADTYKHSCRIISDKTYVKETNSSFSPERTEDFHRYFKGRAKKSCEEGYNLIVIDQSMSNSNQVRYYCFLAQTFQYVMIPVPYFVTEEKLHGKTIRTQASSYQAHMECPNLFKHLFCGWFLHDVDSAELREEASLYARDCFDIPEFDEMFSKTCKPHDFKSHYNMENTRQDLASCIVKILRNHIDAKEYMSTEDFQRFFGGMSKLYVVGFIISPHMIAARVKLTFDQKKLWKMPDDLNENVQPDLYPSELLKGAKVIMPSESVSLLSSKSNRTLISGKINHEPTDVIPSNSRGRSCHILLGKVKDAPKRNVDYDVPFAISREKNVVAKYADDVMPYDLSRSLVRRIGKYWIIYLKETIIVNGLFATCCSAESSVA